MNPIINDIEERLTKLQNQIENELKDVKKIENLILIEKKYIGKKGFLDVFFRELKNFSYEDKTIIGSKINIFKKNIISFFKNKKFFLENIFLEELLQKEKIDVTLPGFVFNQGVIHPLNQIIEQIENFFLGLGYSIYDGLEITDDFYNFEMLNMSENHPSRDMQDSFYLNISSNVLLRTHTSAVQIQAMLKKKTCPLKIISSGKVYRRDKDDDTHSHQFMQLEGFLINYCVTLIELKEIILNLIKYLFGSQQKCRFRPSYFPFTKPSLEVDLIMRNKNNEPIYLEIMGAGLIHPEVLNRGNFTSQKYQGLAFGIGIERITMLKYGIKDIRYFYNNDIRFLKQFV